MDPYHFKKINHDLNFCGYKTWFTAYHSIASDSLVKAAFCMQDIGNIKYIIPLRPYSVSPEYCSMLAMAFEEIENDRMAIALLPGGIQDDEKTLDLLVESKDKFDTIEKRMSYIDLWMEKFKKKIGRAHV